MLDKRVRWMCLGGCDSLPNYFRHSCGHLHTLTYLLLASKDTIGNESVLKIIINATVK